MEFFFSNVWTGLTNLDLSRLSRLSFLIFLFLFLGMGTENIKFNSQILRREVCSRLFVVKKILGNRELLKGFVSLSVVCLFVSLSVCLCVCFLIILTLQFEVLLRDTLIYPWKSCIYYDYNTNVYTLILL